LILKLVGQSQTKRNELRKFGKQYTSVAVLSEISNLTPSNVRLITISTRLSEKPGKKASKLPKELTLEGIILGDQSTMEAVLAAYLLRLSDSPIFERPIIKKKDATIFNLTGWARSLSGEGSETAEGVAVDRDNFLYLTGDFSDGIDLDPGLNFDSRSGEGAYLVKLDPDGYYRWGRTWGESGDDIDQRGVAVSTIGNVYVMGEFEGTIDFDPGPGIEIRSSEYGGNAYLSKFDSYGNFLWVLTWGDDGWAWGNDVEVDSVGNVYVTGGYQGVVDFKPGPGVDEHVSIEEQDACLSKFGPDGDFLWAVTWGGVDDEEGVSVAVDASDNVYITGNFEKTVDFDPGPGIVEFTSEGHGDIFLSKFNSNGDFIWAWGWGGNDTDRGKAVAVDNCSNVFVTGLFEKSVDFDPGSRVDMHTAVESHDVFLSKFTSDGNYLWAVTWGGEKSDKAEGIVADYRDDIYITGTFWDTVDFDPGAGTEERYIPDTYSGFLSKFDSSGYFRWVHTWDARAYDVATDYSDNAYVIGRYSAVADLNPGPVFDPHVARGYSDAYLSRFPADGDW